MTWKELIEYLDNNNIDYDVSWFDGGETRCNSVDINGHPVWIFKNMSSDGFVDDNDLINACNAMWACNRKRNTFAHTDEEIKDCINFCNKE